MRVSFYTLGCKVNQNETGALAQLFRQNGYTLAGPDEEADVFVVNSCTVTAGAIKKAASGCGGPSASTPARSPCSPAATRRPSPRRLRQCWRRTW